jgi:hypothetical protein
MKASSLMVFLVLAGAMVAESASAQAWSLTNDQRRAYLRYYSPILMYRTNEDVPEHRGFGWMTNYDYDRDFDFSSNKLNWRNLPSFISGASGYANWTIRPTMYTAIIEYMELNGTKSVTLLYHVYHAMEEGSVHDWERIEVQVNNVNGTPGSGTEAVKYVVVTQHDSHDVRLLGSGDLNFQVTPNGKHPMIWQAEWNGGWNSGPHEQELRFVENSFSWVSGRVAANGDADVDVNGASGKKNVHYVFVNDADANAVSFWNAQTITFANAASMYSGKDDGTTVKWSGVKRIKYELQDLADIIPTNWESGGYAPHWRSVGSNIQETENIYKWVAFESPIINELGGAEVGTGLQLFYNMANDDEDPTDTDSKGYLTKSWLWGAYDFGGNDSRLEAMFDGASSQPNRATASGDTNSPGYYWWQHDYFVHNGLNCDPTECGRWLPGNWYTPAAGGFDGRWVQLFND